jgi:hypothetical protein
MPIKMTVILCPADADIVPNPDIHQRASKVRAFSVALLRNALCRTCPWFFGTQRAGGFLLEGDHVRAAQR